jgi:hypothetical protein
MTLKVFPCSGHQRIETEDGPKFVQREGAPVWVIVDAIGEGVRIRCFAMIDGLCGKEGPIVSTNVSDISGKGEREPSACPYLNCDMHPCDAYDLSAPGVRKNPKETQEELKKKDLEKVRQLIHGDYYFHNSLTPEEKEEIRKIILDHKNVRILELGSTIVVRIRVVKESRVTRRKR